MKASVIVCSFNRSSLLKESVLSIQRQDFNVADYEIVVVDNNSTDDTKTVISGLAASSGVKIKYVFESRQGLSFARNAGIAAAEGEIVVFTDDDIAADRSWLGELLSAFDDADVAAAGGPIRPIWMTERPEWLTERWTGYFAVSEFKGAQESGLFRWPVYPWGANVAFRKSVFSAMGMFPTDLGRIGTCLLSNEEILLCSKIEESGKIIKFVPGAVIHHKISAKRLKKQWLQHRTYWQGVSDAILDQDRGDDIYSHLRKSSASLLRQEVERKGSEFDRACAARTTRGYLHQRVFPALKGGSNFGKVRAVETFVKGLVSEARDMMEAREKTATELKKTLAAKDEELRDVSGRLKKREEELKVLGPLDEKLRRLDESLRTLDKLRQNEEQLRQYEVRVRQNEERLRQYETEARQNEELLRQKEMLLASRDEELKQKDRELALQRESLMGLLKNTISDFRRLLRERERLEGQIALRNSKIAEILRSVSWKVSAPLRVVYRMLGRHKK